MAIWAQELTLDQMNATSKNTMVEFLDIKLTERTEDSLIGEMPVSDKVRQPFGIVHGGANCVLAETLGSFAANFVVDYKTQHAVGLSINTSHIKAVRNGVVTGIAKPIHLGRRTHVWEIKTYNSSGDISSISQLTMAVIDRLKNEE